MKLFLKIAGAAVLLVAGLAVYANFFPPYTNRFRLTIEVQTPEGVKSGSSTIETTFWESGGWGPPETRNVHARARGEAVFVDLGNHRNVVGLLGFGSNGSDDSGLYGLTRNALAPGRSVNWKDEQNLRGRGELTKESLPTLAFFRDINDPTSGIILRPEDFEKTFGSGVRLQRAIIETTDAPIRNDIARMLPFLNTHQKQLMRNLTYERRFVPQYHMFIRD